MRSTQSHGDQHGAVMPAVMRLPAGAKYLSVCLGTFEKLAKANAFPLVRIGERAIGVAREDLDSYIRSRRYWAGGPNAGQTCADTSTTS